MRWWVWPSLVGFELMAIMGRGFSARFLLCYGIDTIARKQNMTRRGGRFEGRSA